MAVEAEREFYEDRAFWDPARYDALEVRRVDLTWRCLPAGTQTLLDVGCGNGIFANAAPAGVTVCAADRAFAPLEFVAGSKLQADASALPFADRTFDAVVSLEMLEHLPHDAFRHAVAEIARVSRRHIVISVPFREDRRAGRVRCPGCDCRFHLHYHMRSFERKDLHGLFDGASRRVRLAEARGIVRVPKRVLAAVANRIKLAAPPRWSFAPYAVCPQCGYSRERPAAAAGDSAGPAGGEIAPRSVLGRLWPRRPGYKWWLARYEIED